VTSIRRRLMLWLMAMLALGAVLIALATYLFSLEEMNEVFDEQLRQAALTVLAHYQGGVPAVRTTRPMPRRTDDDEDLEGLDFVTQVWTLAGERVFLSEPQLQLPLSRVEGFQTVNTPAGTWRVYTDRSAGYFIQAAQAQNVRARLAADVALKILIPSLAAAPLLAGLLFYALRRGLEPLTQTTRDIEQRSALSLEPIEARPLPAEIQPLVASINALMARLAQAMSAQRRFTADAAHELRTPLAALRLQMQLLATAPDEASRAEALADMRLGLERATRLVEQLLLLSRLEPDAEPMHREPIDLARLARSVVADFAARAETLGIDLGADVGPAGAHGERVVGDAEQLRVLLNNLVDNALRHTPRGGKVDVRVRMNGRPSLAVIDSGSGVPESEHGRIFRRFYRRRADAAGADVPAGSAGLGLAIVEAVAQRHAARIALSRGQGAGDGNPGLAVQVTFEGAVASLG
jgi:two-component system OmpR family sensor kinase